MLRSFGLATLALPTAGCVVDAVDAPVDRVEWLAMRAAEVRQLEYLRPVPIEYKGIDEYADAQEQAAAEITDEDLDELRQAWGRLGFFPLDTDLRAEIAVSRGWVGGFYVSDKGGKITLIGQPREALVVHEHVHALQDQHFDLVRYKKLPDTDGRFGRRAITEGDATLAELRFYVQEDGVDLQHVVWNLEKAREDSEKVLEEASLPFLQVVRSFVYYYGFEHCLANLTGYSLDTPQYSRPAPFDWTSEDELFQERAPRTTWEVLRRESEPPEGHSALGIDEVPVELADQLETLGSDVAGAWYSYVLLRRMAGEPGVGETRPFADAWRGDRVLFLRDRRLGGQGLAWISAWQDEDVAARVAEAYRLLHGVELDDPLAPFTGLAGDGERVWIERRGSRVVALKNVPPNVAPALVEAVFAGTGPLPDADDAEQAPESAARERIKLAWWMERLEELVPDTAMHGGISLGQ